MNHITTKKMYKQPQTETMPVEPANILCVSGEDRVIVDSLHPIDFYQKVY